MAEAGFAPENDVVATTATFPDVSGLATDPEGDSLIAWDARPNPEAPEEAKARWLSPSGELGAVLDLSAPTAGRAIEPQVAMAPTGRAFVAWRVLHAPGDPADAVGRWVEADGSLGPLLTIALGETGTMDVVEVTVVVDAGGVASVVWDNQASGGGLSLRRIQPDATVGPVVPDFAAGGNGLETAALPNGSTVAVWRGGDGTNLSVVTGALSYDPQQVISSNNETADPALAIDALGNVLVAWKEGSEDPFSVEGRLLAPNGAPAGGPLLIDPSFSNELGSEVAVAADSANDFLVAWARQAVTGNYVISARGLDSEGTFKGLSQPLSADDSTNLFPQAMLDDAGAGAVAWSRFLGMSTAGALARTTDASGAPTGEISQLESGRPVRVSSAPQVGFAAFLMARSDGAEVRRYLEPPACSDSRATVKQGKPIVIPLACNGLAIEGAQVTAAPAHGQLGPVDPASLSLSYTPQAGFDGDDAFSFTGVNDGGASNAATVSIDVGKDTLKPKIRRFRFVKRKRRMKFVLKISEPARVRILVARRGKKGKRLGRLKTKKLKRKAVIRVRGKLAKKLLAGGRFKASAVATDPARNKSRPRRLKFALRG
jgi:hypothetical protein